MGATCPIRSLVLNFILQVLDEPELQKVLGEQRALKFISNPSADAELLFGMPPKVNDHYSDEEEGDQVGIPLHRCLSCVHFSWLARLKLRRRPYEPLWCFVV